MPVERSVLITSATEFLAAADEARVAANAANRKKTALKNNLREYSDDHGFKDYKLGIGPVELYLGVSVAEKIDPKAIIKMFLAGEITEEQFAEIIDVRKDDAKRVLGGDVVDANIIEVRGKEVDVRSTKVDVEYAEPVDVLPRKVTQDIPTKPQLVKPRVIRTPPKVATLPTRERLPLRRITK